MRYHYVGVWLSDVTLYILINLYIGFAIHAWRARSRNGPGIRAFSIHCAAQAIFFGWFGLVYLDRRFNIIPQYDLFSIMGYEWYWPFRLMLILAVTNLWWVMLGPVNR